MTRKLVSFPGNISFYFFVKAELVNEKLYTWHLATRSRLIYYQFEHCKNKVYYSAVFSESIPNIIFEMFKSGKTIPEDLVQILMSLYKDLECSQWTKT